jgi:hypothetical protein
MNATTQLSLYSFPNELLLNIFKFLQAKDHPHVARVCKIFYIIITDPTLSFLSKRDLGILLNAPIIQTIASSSKEEKVKSAAFNGTILTWTAEDSVDTHIYLADTSNSKICDKKTNILYRSTKDFVIDNQNRIIIKAGYSPYFFNTAASSLKPIISDDIDSKKPNHMSNTLKNGKIAIVTNNKIEIFGIEGKITSQITIPLEKGGKIHPFSTSFSDQHIAVVHKISLGEKVEWGINIFKHHEDGKQSIELLRYIPLEDTPPLECKAVMEGSVIALYSSVPSEMYSSVHTLQLIDFSLENPFILKKQLDDIHNYRLHNNKLLDMCKNKISIYHLSGSLIGEIDNIDSRHIYSIDNDRIAVLEESQRTKMAKIFPDRSLQSIEFYGETFSLDQSSFDTSLESIKIYDLNSCTSLATFYIDDIIQTASLSAEIPSDKDTAYVQSIAFKTTSKGEPYLLVGRGNEVILYVPSTPTFEHLTQKSDPIRFQTLSGNNQSLAVVRRPVTIEIEDDILDEHEIYENEEDKVALDQAEDNNQGCLAYLIGWITDFCSWIFCYFSKTEP